MSRGIGKTQQLILDALAEHGPYYLAALAPGDMTRYKSLNRAAVRLFEDGHISIINYRNGNPKFVVAHPECKAGDLDRKQVEEVSRRVTAWHKTNSRKP
jgi:hypothetical protein